MSKKDYEKAALIVQEAEHPALRENGVAREIALEAFVDFFRGDNDRFDEDRFRRACVPGANVRARG